MASSHVELYEALKDRIGEDAARMIAEAVPSTREIATKADIGDLSGQLNEFRAEFQGQLNEFRAEFQGQLNEFRAEFLGRLEESRAEVRADIQASTASTLRWMLTFFIPVWAGTWATVIAVILKG